MIRLVQRKLILPRGDTGSFTIPVLPDFNTGDIAVFAIFNPLNKTIIFKKQVEIADNKITIQFSHNETVNLPAGKYLWDIKAYLNPEYADGKLVNGDQIDSYYASYKLPECQIKETADDYLMADDAPTSTLSSAQLDIISAALAQLRDAVQKSQENVSHYPVIINEEWYTWNTDTNQYAGTGVRVPARISDLIDDSGHYTKPANGIPANDIADGVIPDISTKADKVLNATNGNFASLDANGNLVDSGHKHSDYLTEHQDISGKQDVLTFDDSPQMISNNPVKSSGLWNAFNSVNSDITFINSQISSLQNQVVGKQDLLYFDTQPTANSNHPVTSGGIKTAIDTAVSTKQDTLTFDNMPTANSTNPVTSGGVYRAITNIKTMGIHICTSQEYNSQTGIPTVASPDTKTFYLVPGGEGNNLYIEWVYVNNAWQQFGGATIDLSGYALLSDIPSNVSEFTNDAGYLTQHQDITGKQDVLTFDNVPTINSTNPVISNGIYTAINNVIKVQETQPVDPNTKLWIHETNSQTVQVPTVSEVEDMISNAGYLTQHQDISGKADKSNTVLNTTLSRGRKANTTIGEGSFAFGDEVTASGTLSHAEGYYTTASGGYSHAEGASAIAQGGSSHAEGADTRASGNVSHAEGTNTVASGMVSHAEGANTIASGDYSHAEGTNTIAAGDIQHVSGKYNIQDLNNTYAEIVGIGSYDNSRANGRTLDWNGNAWYAGKVSVGNTTPTENNDLTSKAYVDSIVPTKVSDLIDDSGHYTKPVSGIPASDLANNVIPDISNKIDKVNNAVSGNFAALDANGNLTDSGSKANDFLTQHQAIPVTDVQVDGTSVLSNGVANIPIASSSTFGVIKVGNGLQIGQGKLNFMFANNDEVKAGTDVSKSAAVSRSHFTAFYGLAKAAGDTTQASSSNSVGTYTETAQSKIHEMLDAPVTVTGRDPVISGKAGIRYICGECDTMTLTPPSNGIVDVVFTSGTTPTVLSVPNTVKWPDWFDPTSLEASATYEINIMNGTLGAVGIWT